MDTDLGPIQDAAAKSWGLDPTYFKAIGSVESGNNAAAPNSSAGAQGPMQVMPGTASDMGVTDPTDVTQNVYASAKYLSQQLDKYGNPDLAAAAYNSGPGRVDDYLAGKASLPDETLAYVPKVAAAYKQFSTPSGGGAPSASTSAPVQVASADTGTQSDAGPGPVLSMSATPPAASGQADPFSAMMTAAQAHVGSASSAAAPAAASPTSTAQPADPFSTMMAAASAHAPASPSGASAPAAIPVVQPSAASAVASTGGSPTAATGPAVSAAAPNAASLPPGFVSTNPNYVAPTPSPQSQSHREVLGNLAAGVKVGFENVAGGLAALANKADQAVPALQSLDNTAGLNPAQAATSIKQDVAANDAAGSGSLAYGAGRFAGTVAGTAPLVETGAGALGLVGDAAAAALPGAATAIRAGTNLLTGGGNATGVARFVNAATSGAGKAAAAGIAANGGTDGIRGNALTGAVLGPAASYVGPYISSGIKAAGSGIAGAVRALAGDAGGDASAGASAAVPNQLAAPALVPPVTTPANPLAAPLPAGTRTAGEPLTPGYRPQATPPSAAPAEGTSSPASSVSSEATPAVPAEPTATTSTATGSSGATSTPPEAIRLGLFSSPQDGAKLGEQVYNDYLNGSPNTVTVPSKILGVNLTAAQATGNANVALLERTRRAANPAPFVALEQANDAARNTSAQGLIGTPESLAADRNNLVAMDAQLQPQVFGNQQPVSTQPITDAVQTAIKANAGRPTVQGPLLNVSSQIQAITGDDDTAAPRDLWNVRKYLGDMVAPRAAGTANDGQAAAAELMGLKPVLDTQIEQGAPGFQNYLQQYQKYAAPISAQEYLQSKFPTDAQGNIQLGRLDTFIKGITNAQNKSGYNPADDISDDQMQGLTDLRDDLRLKSNVDLGKARGSDTVANLFTNNRVANIMQGATPQVAGLLAGGLGGLTTGSGIEGTGAAAVAGRFVANKLAAAQANRLAATRSAAEQAIDNLLMNPYRSAAPN